MSEADMNVTRRTLFAAGGLGLIAVAGLTGTAEAAASEAETANIKLVGDFCKSWGAKGFDPDKATATFLAPDCMVRMVENQPAANGPPAVAAIFKSFMPNGERIDVKISQTFAKGPVVVNVRVDTLTSPGKPAQAFPVVGVFIVKDGKIKEWSDYLIPKA